MPELPEVQTVADSLDACLPQAPIVRARLLAKDLYRPGSRLVRTLCGLYVSGVERVGKAVRFRLVNPSGRDAPAWVVHLGMSGKLLWFDPGGLPGSRSPGTSTQGEAIAAISAAKVGTNHVHGCVEFADGSRLLYHDPRRFGFFYIGPEDGLRATLNIGPDPFELRPGELADRLMGRSAPIKSLLLNQKLVSGLGNIYVDELLFRAGMHPLTAGAVASDSAQKILTKSREVLRAAIRAGGTTFRDYRQPDGNSGRYQRKLYVYDRADEPCRRCHTPIKRIVLSARSTHFCPTCQPPVRRRR